MDRREKIIGLRKKHFSYGQIGGLLGVSRQRVHQILKGYKSTDEDIRESVLVRDGRKCQLCDNDEKLEVHHIDGDKSNNDEHNLVTLCRTCHYNIEKNDRKSGIKTREDHGGAITADMVKTRSTARKMRCKGYSYRQIADVLGYKSLYSIKKITG